MQRCYEAYEKSLSLYADNAAVLNNYAYFLSEEERELERALTMSSRAINLDKNNATYLDTYAWILYKLKRYEEALTYIERAIADDPEPSDVLYEHAGDICHQLGIRHRALDYWYKALDLQRESGTVDKQLEKKTKR
jgi:Tfp pilus assembly protein PilF